MLFVMKYFAKLLSREGYKSLTIPFLALILVFLINLLGGIKTWLESEYSYMMDEYKITAIVSDLSGAFTEGLMISEKYIELFTNPDVMFSLHQYVDEIYLSDSYPPYSESLSVTLKDNRLLGEFKWTAWRSFSRTSPIYDTRPFAMTVYDSAFYDIVESLHRNIILVNRLTPIIQVIAIGIGFITSFLLTRRRKPEFALMQSIGIHKRNIFLGALIEQLLLCTFGTLLGGTIALLAWQYMSLAQSLIFLGFYMLGALFFATKAAGMDVLKILQDKD